MKQVAILIISIFSIGVFGQTDSADYAINDSLYFEENPNYLGINISPLVTSIVGDYDKDVKFCMVYKRNIGYKNLRFSLNHHRTVNQLPYNTYEVINTTDSSYDATFYSSDYKSVDVRFGFEELKGYRHARLHIGADLILGYATYSEKYFTKTLYQDSSGHYKVSGTNNININDGNANGQYFNLGVDVSLGFDWFLSDDFLFTFQITPQFNYNILTSGKRDDDNNILGDPKDFADFKLTYFDVFLVYKF